MISNRTINEKVYKIKELEMKKKEFEEEINKIKDCLKNTMSKEGIDEIKTDKFIIKHKDVTSNRFDTTRFKKEHKDLYESYTVESTTKRFTIN